MPVRFFRATAPAVASAAMIVLLWCAGAARADAPQTVAVADGAVQALANAISAADASGTPTVIQLAAHGTYTITDPATQDTGLPVIGGGSAAANVTIDGNGATIARSDGTGTPAFRLLAVADGSSLTLDHVTVSNGSMAGDGGGVADFGSLTVVDSIVEHNRAWYGGGIFAGSTGLLDGNASGSGSLTVRRSLIDANIATGDPSGQSPEPLGGGMWSNAAELDLDEDTVTANQGGGLAVNSDGGRIDESTVVRNSGVGCGDGIVVLVSAPGEPAASTDLVDDIIADNLGFDGITTDVASFNPNTGRGAGPGLGTITSNLVSNRTLHDANGGPSGCGDPTDWYADWSDDVGERNGFFESFQDVGAAVGPLTDNGGPTDTMAPVFGSAAVDDGTNVSGDLTDARGQPRTTVVTGGDHPGDGTDIGAVEAQSAPGGSLVVTTGEFQNDGTSDPRYGGTSLHEAIHYADELGGPQTITFDIPGAGAHTIDDTWTETLHDISLDNGDGSEAVSIPNGHLFTSGTVTISGITIPTHVTNGFWWSIENTGNLTVDHSSFSSDNGDGGAIDNQGSLTIAHSSMTNLGLGPYNGAIVGEGGPVVAQNDTFTDDWGGIQALQGPNGGGTSPVTVIQCTFTGDHSLFNSSGADGAAINAVSAQISGSTFVNNSANWNGGAVYLSGDGTIQSSAFVGNTANGGGAASVASGSITDSTFANNTSLADTADSASGGGAILMAQGGSLTLDSDTIAQNHAPDGAGGGIELIDAGATAHLQLNNTIVDGNDGGDVVQTSDGSTSVTSGGYNLIGSATTPASFTATGDQYGVGDPGLLPPADNGGPTQTMALGPTSPAYNAGSPTGCPATDQRGLPRPAMGGCDIGAFERQAGSDRLIVSELRLRGPGEDGDAAADYYVDLYNNTSSPLPLSGWRLAFTDAHGQPQTVDVDPSRGTLAPGASFLVVGQSSTLGATYPPDHILDALLDPHQGVAVIAPDGSVSDAAGVTGADPGYIEGTGLADPQAPPGVQSAYVRRFKDGVPVDTGDNRGDFALVSPDPAATGAGAQLGAPAPRGTGSPTARNDILQSGLLDSSVSAQSAPNQIYSSGSPDRLIINRTLTNCSGQPATGVCANAVHDSTPHAVSRLWFRITGLTTVGSPGAGTGQAVLKADNSSGESGVSGATACGPVGSLSDDVQPLALLSPSSPGSGGLNSTWSVTLPGGGLQPGECINIEFTFDVTQRGTFSFAYNTEDDLEAPAGGHGDDSPSTSGTTLPDPGTGSTPTSPAGAGAATGVVPPHGGSATATATPGAGARAGRPRAAAVASATKIRVSGRTTVLALACHGAAGTTCRLTTRLASAATVTRKHRVVVGAATVTLRAGAHRQLSLRLNAAGRRLLVRRRTLVATLTVTQHGSAGKTATLVRRRLVFHHSARGRPTRAVPSQAPRITRQ